MDQCNELPQTQSGFFFGVVIPTLAPILVIHMSIDMVNSMEQSVNRGVKDLKVDLKGTWLGWLRWLRRECAWSFEFTCRPQCQSSIDCGCHRFGEVVLDTQGLWHYAGLVRVARKLPIASWQWEQLESYWRTCPNVENSLCTNACCFTCGWVFTVCHHG